MRYINADALLSTIGHIPEGVISDYDGGRWDVAQLVKEAPTADVEEVRHGSFVWIADDSLMCNICGKVYDTADNADAGLWNYCPHCGAKMDGGDEG